MFKKGVNIAGKVLIPLFFPLSLFCSLLLFSLCSLPFAPTTSSSGPCILQKTFWKEKSILEFFGFKANPNNFIKKKIFFASKMNSKLVIVLLIAVLLSIFLAVVVSFAVSSYLPSFLSFYLPKQKNKQSIKPNKSKYIKKPTFHILHLFLFVSSLPLEYIYFSFPLASASYFTLPPAPSPSSSLSQN